MPNEDLKEVCQNSFSQGFLTSKKQVLDMVRVAAEGPEAEVHLGLLAAMEENIVDAINRMADARKEDKNRAIELYRESFE